MTEVGVVLVVFLLVWVGVAVITDVFIGVRIRPDRRPDLRRRLQNHHPSVADEAQEWLQRQ